MKPFEIFAVVQPGLEKLAARELTSIGIKQFEVEKGGITLAGHQNMLYRLNNLSRIASRFLVRFATLQATSFWELEKELKKLNWSSYISNQNILIRVTSRESTLYHTDAIKERFQRIIRAKAKGKVSFCTDPDQDNIQMIVVTAYRNHFSISMDSTGAHLHKRGYMQWRTEAPLRENIAAAMLATTANKANLIDPMCGSGSIAIEHVVRLRRMPACNFRSFAFERWPVHLKDKYVEYCEGQKNDVIPFKGKVLAWDIDAKAIEDIPEDCALVTNPPYGERLSPDKKLYKKIKELHACRKDLSCIFLVAGNNKTKNQKTIFKVDNGGIPVNCCTYR